MENINIDQKYDVELNYYGYIIEPGSFRITPATLFGTRFSQGRPEYSSMDLWQIGALTDFSKGIGQDFLVDPSRYYFATGIDITTPGEIKLERDLATITTIKFPVSQGAVTAHYRASSALYVGTEDGNILKTTDGETWALDKATGTGQIYNFFEVDGFLFATKGANTTWVYSTWSKIFEYPYTNWSGCSMPGNKYKYGQTFTTTATVYKIRMIKAMMRALAGVLTGNVECAIFDTDVNHKPTGDAIATAEHGPLCNYGDDNAGSEDNNYRWVTFRFSEDITLKKENEYAFVISVIGGADQSVIFAKDTLNPTDPGYAISYDGTDWTATQDDAFIYEIWNQEAEVDAWLEIGPDNLYFVSVESQIIYGYFNDGIRQSEDGIVWIPEPPDPLWALPTGEGIPVNALTIPRGFLLGTSKGLWMLSAGSSGYAIRDFSGQVSTNNFSGFAKYDYFGLFSIENEGIFYTDGKSSFVTNIDSQSNAFPFRSCAGIESLGQDIFALVKNSSDEWYLARSNQRYFANPTHFTMVKKLSKEPSHLSSFGTATVKKIYIHYADETTDVLDLVNGVYQTTGYLTTSKIDENLIKLQKLYKNISVILSESPANSKISIAYALDNDSIGAYEDNTLTASSFQVDKELLNGTSGNRMTLQIKLTKTGTSTPVVTDLTWKFFLERPREETDAKKTFSFTIVAEDSMSAKDGSDFLYTRREILDHIWETKSKKEIFNFVGQDNVEAEAIKFTHASAYTVTIDQVDHLIKFYNDVGVLQHSISSSQTLTALQVAIDALSGYSAELSPDATGTDSGTTLMPISSVSIQGGYTCKSGTSIHEVLITSGTPIETITDPTGSGSTRINLSLREV